jgi:hypothetical protein
MAAGLLTRTRRYPDLRIVAISGGGSFMPANVSLKMSEAFVADLQRVQAVSEGRLCEEGSLNPQPQDIGTSVNMASTPLNATSLDRARPWR